MQRTYFSTPYLNVFLLPRPQTWKPQILKQTSQCTNSHPYTWILPPPTQTSFTRLSPLALSPQTKNRISKFNTTPNAPSQTENPNPTTTTVTEFLLRCDPSWLTWTPHPPAACTRGEEDWWLSRCECWVYWFFVADPMTAHRYDHRKRAELRRLKSFGNSVTAWAVEVACASSIRLPTVRSLESSLSLSLSLHGCLSLWMYHGFKISGHNQWIYMERRIVGLRTYKCFTCYSRSSHLINSMLQHNNDIDTYIEWCVVRCGS